MSKHYLRSTFVLFISVWYISFTTAYAKPGETAASEGCAGGGPVKVVVIGSSTAEGFGVTVAESWVGRYASYLKSVNPAHEVVNLGLGGRTTYNLLPSGMSTPVDDKPEPERNITKALSLNPDAIIVNLPSNDAWDGYSKDVQMANFKIIYDAAQAQGVPVWITTTQPREKGLNSERLAVQLAVRDAIRQTYGTFALDFWTGIATSDNKIKPALALGDGIHLNGAGHKVLFDEVVKQQILEKTVAKKYPPYVSVKSGTYTDKTTWSTNAVPDAQAKVIIKAGHTVSLSADVTIAALTIEKTGKLDLKTYQFSATCGLDVQGTLEAAQATLSLSGDEDMTLTGIPAVKTLKINKNQGTVRLGQDVTVSSNLTLTKGDIALAGHLLTLESSAAITGGSASSYIQTTGPGDLVFKVNSTLVNKPLVFPVGDASNYTPFTFVLKSGSISNGKLSMRVVDSEPVQAGAANPILSRYWDLRQEGLSNYLYDVKYQYTDSDVEVSSGKGEGDLKVIKYSDKDGWLIGGEVNTSTNTLSAIGISSFSIFSGGNNIEGAAPLPVRLLSFQAEATEEGHALLQWKTASEINNDYFAVERSGDAEQWTALAQVKGGGTSHTLLSYRFIDTAPATGNNYYRLKQVDFDGQFEYSPVVHFYSNLATPFDLKLAPNPAYAREGLSVQLTTPTPEGKATLMVSDILGRTHVLREISLEHEKTNLMVQEDLSPGLYLVTVRQGYRVIQKKLLLY